MNKNYIKFGLDFIMLVVFALLFNKMVLGMFFHEAAGLALGVAVLGHCLLNWKWVKTVTRSLFGPKLPLKVRLSYLLNVVLLLAFGTIIVTGIMISKELFPNLEIGVGGNAKVLHIMASYIALSVLGIHIGLHWKWVMSITGKLIKVPQRKWMKNGLRGIAVLILAFGLYNMQLTGFVSKLAMSGGGPEHHMEEGNASNSEGTVVKGERPSSEKSNSERTDSEKPGAEGVKRERPEQTIEIGTILKEIGTQVSMASVFIVLTYYFEKMIIFRKRKLLKNVEKISQGV